MKDVLIKKISYKARYRGIKEADKIIGGFVSTIVPALNMQELEDVLVMLDMSDHDILSMMTGTKDLDENHKDILVKMKKYTENQHG